MYWSVYWMVPLLKQMGAFPCFILYSATTDSMSRQLVERATANHPGFLDALIASGCDESASPGEG